MEIRREWIGGAALNKNTHVWNILNEVRGDDFRRKDGSRELMRVGLLRDRFDGWGGGGAVGGAGWPAGVE